MADGFEKYLSTHPGLDPCAGIQEYEEVAKGYAAIYDCYLPSRKDARVLDIGCGQGYFLYYLKSRGFKNIIGVDISAEQVAFCKSQSLPAERHNAESYLLQKRNQFDMISMQDVLEHVPKHKVVSLLEKVHAALKVGGGVIVKVPNMENPFNLVFRYADFTHECGFTSGSLQQVLKIAGFSGVTVLPYEPPTIKRGLFSRPRFGLVARKLVVYVISKAFGIPHRRNGDHLAIQHNQRIFSIAFKQ